MTRAEKGSDGIKRCSWANTAPEFPHYHDNEWGVPVTDDRVLFEKLCLESFQSGLSWRTILVKRENFRKAFKSFEISKVSRFSEKNILKLLQDEGIVRHRGKIEAVINNAQKALELIKEKGSLCAYFWSFEPKERAPKKPQSISKSPLSEQISKDLKKRGWKFVGPTTVYSFMQAMGMINDHFKDCHTWKKVEDVRKKIKIG